MKAGEGGPGVRAFGADATLSRIRLDGDLRSCGESCSRVGGDVYQQLQIQAQRQKNGPVQY